MYRKCIGSDPTAARLDFALYEVAGEWESRSGSPRVRSEERRVGKECRL